MDRKQVRLIWVLTIISAVAGGLLALLNIVTEPKITEQTRQGVYRTLQEVLPMAVEFRADSVRLEEAKSLEGDGITELFVGYDQNDRPAGLAMITESWGYSSNIEVMVGISLDGLVSGIKILNQAETPGLGSKITGDRFLHQPVLQNAPIQQDLAVVKDGGEVEAVTQATVSSRAVVSAVNKALSVARQLLEDL